MALRMEAESAGLLEGITAELMSRRKEILSIYLWDNLWVID